jgi:hypothetical protein
MNKLTVTLEPSGEILISGPGVETAIDLDEAKTTTQLCEWVIYLCQRTWCDTETVEAFIRQWAKANQVSIGFSD